MRISCHPFRRKVLVTALALAMPIVASAETSNEAFKKQLDELQAQVTALNSEVKQAAEWKNPNTVVHMGGYASAGFVKTDVSGDDGSFTVGSFSPIFHFQYRDTVMMETELEIELEDDGATAVKMEYMTIDWFINDNVALVAGQFLSPIGQFRQNTHPAWINKMPMAPPGFGHDGAAPVSDLGVQLRGGFHLGGMKSNYAVYMGNGPELKAEITPDPADITGATIDEIEYDGVSAEAFNADREGEKVFGGRFGILPIPTLEIGLSLLSGKATITEYEGGVGLIADAPDIESNISNTQASDYDVVDVDMAWRGDDMEARAEYVKSKVGKTMLSNTTTTFDVAEAEWTTWYAQFAYKLQPSKYELVVRYTDFDSPHPVADVQQSAVGLNYLFTNNFIGKLGFESNDNPNDGFTAVDRWLLQLAYGF